MSSLVAATQKKRKLQASVVLSHRPTCIEFCKGKWSPSADYPKTPLIVSGGASHTEGGLGCLFLSRVLQPASDLLELRTDHWMPTPGGVTCMSTAGSSTSGVVNDTDTLVIGTDTGNICVVRVNKQDADFLGDMVDPLKNSNNTIALENAASSSSAATAAARCSVTAISVAQGANNVVAVTDSGGVYLMRNLLHDQQQEERVEKRKFHVRENSSLNAVSFLHEDVLFVTAGASPVAQLKLWDPRVSGGSSVVATFKDENSSVSYTSLAGHPTDKHLVMTGTSDGHVCVWDIRQSCVTNRVKKHTGSVTGISFGVPHSQHVYTTCTCSN